MGLRSAFALVALAAAACDTGVELDSPDDIEITLSELAGTPDDFELEKLYAILEAQAPGLQMKSWNGDPIAYTPPQRPLTEEQIASITSGAAIEALGGCDVTGDAHPGRWERTVMVNGYDIYGPGDVPEDEGGEWAEQHTFYLRVGGDGEPAWVVDPQTVTVQFAG